MKINEEKLNETPDEILELLYAVLVILQNHERNLFRDELETVRKAISKI